MPAVSNLRLALALVAGLGPLLVGGCTERDTLDDAGDDGTGADDAGDDEPPPPGSVEAQGITVLATYYEGSIMVLDFTTHPDASCEQPFPWTERCADELDGVWHVSVELVGPSAGPGSYGFPDLSFSEVGHMEVFSGTCLFVHPAVGTNPLGYLELTIEAGGSDGVQGRVDELRIDIDDPAISGSFDAVPCP